jgi:hypothetical protein
MESRKDDAYKGADAKDATEFEKARKIQIMMYAKLPVPGTSGQESDANG